MLCHLGLVDLTAQMQIPLAQLLNVCHEFWMEWQIVWVCVCAFVHERGGEVERIPSTRHRPSETESIFREDGPENWNVSIFPPPPRLNYAFPLFNDVSRTHQTDLGNSFKKKRGHVLPANLIRSNTYILDTASWFIHVHTAEKLRRCRCLYGRSAG